jgi:hypothetical protein
MRTTPTSPHLPGQPAPVSADADLAREVALRFERWYRERQLELPPDVQAGFVEMGVEAVVRNPDRTRDAVLDALVAELDASLSRIKTEPLRDPAPADAGAPRASWWRRWTGRG